ncbi:SUMF1/EgtB/PvdO family nonheme iron enzyme [Xanthomonas citri pv. citri]
MHEDTATVTELVTAMRRGALDLNAVLAALGRRAAVPEAEYRAGVETLWTLQRQHLLDDATVTTLVSRLDALRDRAPAIAPAPAPSAAQEPTPTPTVVDDDATVVMPRPGPARMAENDITRVQPAQLVSGDAPSLTSLGLATHPNLGTQTGTGTGTGTAGTASVSSWQHLAEAAGGDHAGVGSLLKGRFQLERELGRGGMGVVYLARDERKVEARDRDPWLAVKVLSDEFRRHPDALVALQREARRSQKLAHDNIVRVYDFDKDRTLVFMTMEYIDGCDLKTLIREQAYNGMPLKQAWPLIDGMGRALMRAQCRSRTPWPRHLDEVIARFGAQDPQHYRDETQAMQALSSLSADDRRRVLMDRSDLIEDFLLRRLDALWNPANGRDDYRGALQVFALRDRLRLYSPALDARRQAIEREKNQRLNALDTTLNRQLDAGLLFRTQPDNALATLDQVRRIDPGSSLLRHSALEVRLDAAIAEAVAAGQLTTARTEVEQARAAFPDSLRLQLRSAEVGVAEQQVRRTPVAATPRDADSARTALAADLANPSTDPAWRARIDAELAALPAAERSSQGSALAEAISTAVAVQSDPAQLAGAQALVDFGLGLAPRSASLLAQRMRLQTLEHQFEQALARESAEAELAARIESLRRAAAANDLGKTRDALARIRTLQPGHPLLRSEGPQLLSQVYRNTAGDAFAQGRYAQAADLLRQGLQTLGQRAELRSAQTRYAVAAAVMTAGALPPSERQQLAGRLQTLYRTDAIALAQLEAQMKAAGQLPEGSLSARLQRARAADAPADDSVPPGSATGTAAPAVGAKPARDNSAARPAAATPTTARDPAAAAALPANVDDADSLPPVPTGPDPCAGLAGRGAACFDTLGQTRAPMLVVIPAIAGGKPYALSRGEVAVADFNLFCQATGRCTAQAAATPELARAPVRNISLTLAQAYLRWLTIGSGGWRYRLPSDAEWLHAAQAASNWRQAEDSNCVPPNASAGDAARAPVSARGRDANPWGLINLTGNVWEWVSTGTGLQARGGSFSSYWSDCTVQASRADNGSAQPDVGLRVLRELP